MSSEEVANVEVEGVRLFVGNLPFKTTNEDLIELFNEFGEVKLARLAIRNRRALGYGFVTMADQAAADAAVAKVCALLRSHSYVRLRQGCLYLIFSSAAYVPSTISAILITYRLAATHRHLQCLIIHAPVSQHLSTVPCIILAINIDTSLFCDCSCRTWSTTSAR